MAIRKFRKQMKPFIIVITVVFLLSLAYGGIVSMQTNRANKKAQEAFRINGDYIQKVEVEREKGNISQNLSQSKIELDPKVLTVIALDRVIDNHLIEDVAKSLGIKISNSEINDQYEATEKMIGDKDQFKRMLKAQGHSKDSFKAEIEKNLRNNKVREVLAKQVEIDEDEVNYMYRIQSTINPNFTKEYIEDNYIRPLKAQEKLTESLYALKKEAKIEEVAAEYADLMMREDFNENGISVTNVDISNAMIQAMLHNNATKENARDVAIQNIKDKLKIVKIAKDKGVDIDTTKLPLSVALSKYTHTLVSNLKKEIKYSENDLLAYFNLHKVYYEVPESASANILVLKLAPSPEDEKIAKEAAEKVLAEVTAQNFEEKGKELAKSEGFIFEKLGTFQKGQMVKEFEYAVIITKSGEVAKSVVKTGYGYHVIHVLENGEKDGILSANHIMARVALSEETKKENLAKAEKIKNDLAAGSITFDSVAKSNPDVILNTNLPSIIRGVPLNMPNGDEISDAILNSKLNDVEIKVLDGSIAIYQKLSEQAYKAANFEDAKEAVRNDYLTEKVNQSLSKLF